MAIASVGTLGSVGIKTANQSSAALTTTATAEAGNLVVFLVAVDNHGTTDADHSEVSGVVDSAGNTYTKAKEFTNGDGAAQAGVTVSVWYKKLTTQLDSGGTITASFTNNTSRDASALSAWEFTIAGDPAVEATNQLAVEGLGWSLDATTSNISCLRVLGVGTESSNTFPMGDLSGNSWTIMTTGISTGGGSASNIGVRGIFRISTGTSDNAVPDIANTTHVAAYVAFKENAAAKVLDADAGSYSVTGQTAALEHRRQVVADAGSYAVSGQTVTLSKGLTLSADAGSYAVTGQDVTFNRTYAIDANAGSYAVTGTAAGTLRGYVATADAGSYSVSGQDATFVRTWQVNADAGSYSVSGTDAALLVGRVVIADAGSYSVSGTDADLEHEAGVDPFIDADAGSYAVSGTDASLEWGRVVAADAGAYAVSGTDVTFDRTYVVTADAGSYTISGTDATFDRTYQLVPDSGAYSVSGTDADLVHLEELILAADAGSYEVTGSNVILLADYRVAADSGSYEVSGTDADLAITAAPVEEDRPGGGTLVRYSHDREAIRKAARKRKKRKEQEWLALVAARKAAGEPKPSHAEFNAAWKRALAAIAAEDAADALEAAARAAAAEEEELMMVLTLAA
jgi:hypothetical protein